MPPDLPPAFRLQSIPPRWAHFCLSIEKFLVDDLAVRLQADVVIALSGGVDSTALLMALHLLSPRLGLRLHPAHRDHGIRAASDRDRNKAEECCGRLGLALHHHRRDIPVEAARAGIGLEEAGRLARYEFLEDVRGQAGAQWIALGHQLDDLAEDQLLRLVRGAGWPALGGMSAVCPERRLVRPLLLTPKRELEAFLTALGIGWIEDASNAEDSYLRNRLRHQVLPLLLAENPNYLENAAGLWRLARLDEEHWTSLGRGIPPGLETSGGFQLSSDILGKLDRASRLRLYKNILDRQGSGQTLQETLFQLDEAWRDGRTGRTFQLPGAKTVIVAKEGLIFKGPEKPVTHSVEGR